MAEFEYTARSGNGQKVVGSLEAETEAAVLRLLDEKKLFPVQITAKRSTQPDAAKVRVRATDLGLMYSQLADLLNTGVPLLRSLDSIARSTVNKKLAQVIRDVRAEVAEGKALFEAMQMFPQVFPSLHVVMVRAGERASFLEDVLASLATFIERVDELRGTVVGALIYPAILALVGTIVMVGALVFFVPQFEPLLEDAVKPLPTVVVFGMSTVVRGYWFVLIPGVVALCVGLYLTMRTEAGQRALERWRLKIPIVGNALRMVAITRFCRILGTMLANGVPLLQALAISKDAIGSKIMSDRIAQAAESVRAGESLSGPLSVGGFFPDQVLAMIAVAEESNQLEKVLLQIADTVERRTNRQVDQAVRLIEPLVLCLVAGAIGFIAMGLILPIFTMAGSLGN
ncbi:MAG: type II secretion system F family protein [Phycisphaeraceae bacterium]